MFRVNAGCVESDVGGASKLAAPPGGGGASSSAVVLVKALPSPDTPRISSSKANAAGGENEAGAMEHNAPTVTRFATKSFCNTPASRVFPPLSEEESEESEESDKAPTTSDDDEDDDENVNNNFFFFFFFTTKVLLFEEKAE